ncbi:PaaI family thioesterase [Gottfriedia acidiceleris]|uniref:PaaI family thioesterase n=1 Tax=Gottfriedia acidiceleris TaxID=371036 RepID=UPI003D250BD2
MSVKEVEKLLQQHSFDRHIGITVKELKEANIILELTITPSLLNYNQKVHGGVIAALLDTAMGMMIRTVVGERSVTVNLNISYLAPANENETLIATAKIVNRGQNLVTVESEVKDRKKNLLSKAIGTFKIMYSK